MNSRHVREKIDALAAEGHRIIDRCRAEGNRLPSADETARFDQITDIEIPRLKNEEAAALRDEKLQLSLSRHGQANEGRKMISAFNSNLHRMMSGHEQAEPSQHAHVRSLRAFRSEQAAFDGGQWLRAIVARTHMDSVNVGAEEHCKAKGLTITNVSTEGTGPAGGYLVPAPLAATIIEVREMVGVARQVCDVQPMTSDTLTIPKRAGGLTVYAPGEGNTITDSDKEWSNVSLTAKKRAVASFITQELSDDALINIVDNVFTEMAFALAQQEDLELINGDGSGATYFGVNGLLNKLGSAGVSQAATGHDTWGELDIADFAAATAKLPDRYFPFGPSWICSIRFSTTRWPAWHSRPAVLPRRRC